MINSSKELPQNTTVIQSEYAEKYSKVPMTARSRGSQWITKMGNNGQQWITMDNNGQQWTIMDNK